MKYHFNIAKHACTYVVVPVNGLISANLTYIGTHIAGTIYSYHWDGLVVSYGYSAGIVSVLYCIMAVFCIYPLLEAIYLRKQNFKNKLME